MDYRRSEFAKLDNRRCRCAAATMNLEVTPLSSDFKKNGAGFVEREFWGKFFNPFFLRRETHVNHVHLKVQTTSNGFGGGGRGGGSKKTKPPPSPNPAPFLEVTTNFERLYTWSDSLYFRMADGSEWCCWSGLKIQYWKCCNLKTVENFEKSSSFSFFWELTLLYYFKKSKKKLRQAAPVSVRIILFSESKYLFYYSNF